MALHRLKQSVLIITKYCEFESNPWYVVTSMCTLDIDSNFVNLRCTFVKIFLNSKKKHLLEIVMQNISMITITCIPILRIKGIY